MVESPPGMTLEELAALTDAMTGLAARLDAIEKAMPPKFHDAAHAVLHDALTRAFERINAIEARLDEIEKRFGNGPKSVGATVHTFTPQGEK